MLSGQESRNQFNENLFTQETKTILERVFGLNLPSIPHGDTLAYLWKKLPPALEKLRLTMVYRLLRSRCTHKGQSFGALSLRQKIYFGSRWD